jgi:hypothetical protein
MAARIVGSWHGVLIASVCAFVAAGSDARAASCDPPGAQDPSSTRQVRVFRLPAPQTPEGTAWYACLFRVGRVVPLRPYLDFLEIVPIAVADPYFAYAAANDDFRNLWWINSMNLVTGKYAHGMTFRSDLGHVLDLVVKRNGSMAWDSYAEQGNPVHVEQTVHIADTHGQRVPPHGHNVVVGSLRLRGSTLRWRKGRRRFSTPLF